MATDYQLTVSLKNKTTNVTTQLNGFTITGEDHEDSGIWSVTTSEISHTIDTDLANVAGVFVWNLAASNFVEIGYSTGVYVHKVPAGTAWIIPLEPGETQLFLAADTATQAVLYRFFEAA